MVFSNRTCFCLSIMSSSVNNVFRNIHIGLCAPDCICLILAASNSCVPRTVLYIHRGLPIAPVWLSERLPASATINDSVINILKRIHVWGLFFKLTYLRSRIVTCTYLDWVEIVTTRMALFLSVFSCSTHHSFIYTAGNKIQHVPGFPDWMLVMC